MTNTTDKYESLSDGSPYGEFYKKLVTFIIEENVDAEFIIRGCVDMSVVTIAGLRRGDGYPDFPKALEEYKKLVNSSIMTRGGKVMGLVN